MTTSYDLSELQALLHTLPARLRLVADYVSREDALEREAAAELLDECATRLEAQRDPFRRCLARAARVCLPTGPHIPRGSPPYLSSPIHGPMVLRHAFFLTSRKDGPFPQP